MTDPEKTDPNFATKAKDALSKATEKSDPWADRILESAKASAYTPWLLVGAVVLLVVLGAILTR